MSLLRSPREHIEQISRSFDTTSRVLRSFTNLSNTVIDTALSGQSKFIFEILQNADDSCRDHSINITVKFILLEGYFIIQHNGKEFDSCDVERICDYASQIKEVKARDLNKTGYKGLGFKSLFNLSKCIYIFSGGYSFRFDKSHWSNPESIPWQIIPIWSNNPPLSEKFAFDESVNFILKIKKAKKLEKLLLGIIDQPELFLYLRHVNNFHVNLFGEENFLERRVEILSSFKKYYFFKNQSIVNTWLSRTFELDVPALLRNIVQKGSEYTYPDKIKNATKVPITFTLKIDEAGKEIMEIEGLCFNTLPTQLHLTLPYHINSSFILNLDRTQLDENDWNEFLLEKIGYMQVYMLKDLANEPHLKNFVIKLLRRKINHPYVNFNRVFSRGFTEAKNKIAWLPSREGSRLLKLGEAWIDDIKFFQQNFKDVRDEISRNIIEYDVMKQYLLSSETKHFTFDLLFNNFSIRYYPNLSDESYVSFLSYLYESLKTYQANAIKICQLKEFAFLRKKNGKLTSPKNALLEEYHNPIPDFFELNPVDNRFLPSTDAHMIRDWLVFLGVKQLKTPVHILRESLFKWIDSDNLDSRITVKNHIGIIDYLTENVDLLTKEETDKLKECLTIYTKRQTFESIKNCYLPDTLPIKELEDVIYDNEKISPVYNMNNLKKFLAHLSILNRITPIKLLRRSILKWIENREIKYKLKIDNYSPIVDYFASQYSKIEGKLTESERSDMKKMPVLTCSQTFQKAKDCYFDSALPNVPGFERLIAEDILVSTANISREVCEFLEKVGVIKEMEPINVIRKSIFKWIREDSIQNKINLSNHQCILKYIAEKWEALQLSGINPEEKEKFKRFPILTASNTFKEACRCYWRTDDGNCREKIPHIESIISASDFVSSEYISTEIKNLLDNFGVRSLTFTDVYKRYCEYLNDPENIRWFFFHLIKYWENRSLDSASKLLENIKKKLKASSLLAKNGKMYLPRELYSFRFSTIHCIDPSALPLLDYMNMPEGLENFLGFKNKLQMPCIVKLLEAFDEKQKNGTMDEEKTRAFFITLLEQLRHKNISEIKRYTLKLLSEANELKSAKELYYFVEEDAKCKLNECYLKRICGMSHNETLKLAELCGVKTLNFNIEASFRKQKHVSTLKEFYLERLSFIILKESKKRNENSSTILQKLFELVCSIELIECQDISIKYPFGESVNERYHFDNMKFYVIEDWRNYSSSIHKYIKENLDIEADIDDITDMQSVSQKKKKDWLRLENEDPQRFYRIEEELQNLILGQSTVAEQSPDMQTDNDVDPLLENVDSDDREDQTIYPPCTVMPMPSRQENEPSVHQDTWNTLKKLYINRLPFIVISECQILNQSPYVVLKRLYPGVSSIELIIDNFIDRKSSCNIPADVNYCFQGLRIYVRGQWTDFKAEIHQHIVKELCLSSKVEDIESIMENNKEWIRFRNENLQTFQLIEEQLRKLLERQANTNNEEMNSGHEGILGADNVRQTVLIDEIPKEKSAENIDQKRRAINSNDSDVVKDRLNPKISRTRSKKSQDVPSSLMEKLPSESIRVLPRSVADKSHVQRLNESYVFKFLQDHYKNKYLNASSNLFNGYFTLQWKSHKVDIIWLNENKDKQLSYDITLKKNGEVKQLIEVRSSNKGTSNVFNINHCLFPRDQLTAKPEEAKCCIYYVFNIEYSSSEIVEPEDGVFALYKIVPLKFPQV